MSEIRDIMPKQTLYLAAAVVNNDGSIDTGFEECSLHVSKSEALDRAKDDVDEHGIETYIYECRPIKRIFRTSVVVEDLS